MTDLRDRQRFLEGSGELADALELKPHEAANLVRELRDLDDALKLTEKRKDKIKAQLRAYMETHDGEIVVEGLPRLFLEPRSRTNWNIALMRRECPELFQRLLDLECVTVETTKARMHAKAGDLVYRLADFEIKGEGTPAMVWDREAK